MLNKLLQSIEDWFWGSTKLPPVEVNILSISDTSDSKHRTEFKVKFDVKPTAWGSILMETTGVFESDETFDNESLMQLMKTTEYHKYIRLNMKRREYGSFSYEYEYNNKWLIVDFKTF